MTTHDTLEATLIKTGFSKYEAEVYVAVLELTTPSVADIAATSSVPRSRVYDVLRGLERSGCLQTYEEDSLRARIDDPSAVIADLTERSKAYTQAANGIEEAWERPKLNRNRVVGFRTREGTINETRRRLTTADNVVHLVASLEDLRALKDSLATLRNNDTKVRVVVHGDREAVVDSAEAQSLYSTVASEVRFCSSLLPFVALVNGRTTVFGVGTHRTSEYGLVVDDHTLSSILHWYFEIQLWEPWETIHTVTADDDMTYVSIRELIRDIEALRSPETAVVVQVEGIATHTGEQTSITGTVETFIDSDTNDSENDSLTQPFIQAAIAVDDGETTYTVGGYGAILEDIRAIETTVVSIG